MVRDIVHDPIFLAQRAAQAAEEDLSVAQDLMDTLDAHRHECVGMAANMIGVNKAIIVVLEGESMLVMLNPEIIEAKSPYQTEEGCLSIAGIHATERYHDIKVRYQNMKMQVKQRTLHGFAAQIVQHEIDHLQGILI